VRSLRQVLQDWFIRQITRRRRVYRRFVYNDEKNLKDTIRPGDVLLVDGDQRVSQAVKYLTQSSWSHSAIFIGDALLRKWPARRADLHRKYGREGRFLVVEALVERGVITSPLTKYLNLNIRICRPIGLRPDDLEIVLDHVISKIGYTYDRRNFLDLTRYLLPFHLVPPTLREEALHFGSGKDTETICSTVIAEAFERVRYPILPLVVRRRKARTQSEKLRQRLLGRPTRYAYSGLLRARHPTLVVPRDFDLSPYFEIVKFNAKDLETFDYRKLQWEVGPS
jgi:hypothetical protein